MLKGVNKLKYLQENFRKIAINNIDNKEYDIFVDAFDEFIYQLNEADLSNNTLDFLYHIFIKDMNIYFENKKYNTT